MKVKEKQNKSGFTTRIAYGEKFDKCPLCQDKAILNANCYSIYTYAATKDNREYQEKHVYCNKCQAMIIQHLTPSEGAEVEAEVSNKNRKKKTRNN
jgi:hypothetical protein